MNAILVVYRRSSGRGAEGESRRGARRARARASRRCAGIAPYARGARASWARAKAAIISLPRYIEPSRCESSGRPPSRGRAIVVAVRVREGHVLPEVADRVGLLGQGAVVRDEEAALAGREVLARLKREAARVAERADGPPVERWRRAPAPRLRRRRAAERARRRRIAFMSAAHPCMCTGMMARVCGGDRRLDRRRDRGTRWSCRRRRRPGSPRPARPRAASRRSCRRAR